MASPMIRFNHGFPIGLPSAPPAPWALISVLRPKGITGASQKKDPLCGGSSAKGMHLRICFRLACRKLKQIYNRRSGLPPNGVQGNIL